MATTCLTCAHGALRDEANADRDKVLRRMAGHGAANCLQSPLRASFHAFTHTCARATPAAAEVRQARERWAGQQVAKAAESAD